MYKEQTYGENFPFTLQKIWIYKTIKMIQRKIEKFRTDQNFHCFHNPHTHIDL